MKCHVLLEIDLLLIGFRQIRTDYSTTRQMPKRRVMGGAWSATTSFPSLPRSIELHYVTQITGKAEISDHQNGLILDHTPSAVPLLPCHARNTRQQSQCLLGNIRFIKQGRTDIGKAMKFERPLCSHQAVAGHCSEQPGLMPWAPGLLRSPRNEVGSSLNQ